MFAGGFRRHLRAKSSRLRRLRSETRLRAAKFPVKLSFFQILPQGQPGLHPQPEPLHGVEAADVFQILFFRLHKRGFQNGEVQLVAIVLGWFSIWGWI